MKKIFAIVSLIGLLLSSICYCYAEEMPRNIIGGRCVYSSYSGRATITRVEKTAESKKQADVIGGAGYEGYEIWFRFKTDQEIEIKEAWARDTVEREHLLQLGNSWYPGPQYIKKYGIEVNKTYSCTLKVITEGTCTPITFEFRDIDTRDYFESSLFPISHLRS